MGRPKGSKNRSTIFREAQGAMVARGLLGYEQDFLDSLAVMEEGMRHFYVRAIAAKQTKQPDKVIDAAMIQAVQIAEKMAPYRHAAFERREAGRWPEQSSVSRTTLRPTNCAQRLCAGSEC